MTDIYINDANVLIDLLTLDLVHSFFKLPYRLCTTDFVLNELEPWQQEYFQSQMEVLTTEPGELPKIIELMDKTKGLSFEDCSVWFHAEKTKGLLITSDNKLRKTAARYQVTVKGNLHIFEEMKNHNCLPVEICIAKLEELKERNPRAPRAFIDNLIADWRE